MLKACVVCGTPSDQARCEKHRYNRDRSRAARRQRLRIVRRDGYRCRRCGKLLAGTTDTHVDHIVPLAFGGPTTDSNLQTLCAACNMAKGTRQGVSKG